MTALIYDVAWLLRRVKRDARRPAVDESMSDADWYDLASDAQLEVFNDVAPRFPGALYGAPLQLVSSDSGATYALPAGASGHFELYSTLNNVSNAPLVPGMDFLYEQGLGVVRIPNNRTRAFPAGGPYFRGAVTPGAIDAATDPSLPLEMRPLIADKMLVMWASRPASGADPAFYDAKYEQQLEQLLVRLATSANLQASEAAYAGRAPWYRSIGNS